MNIFQPFGFIQRDFPFLLDEYGFKVSDEKVFESFGNWAIVLTSDKYCRIRLTQDRGEVSISFGPDWPDPGWEAGPWYDISVVLTALNETNVTLPSFRSSIKIQLETISNIIKPIIPKISTLFKSKNYEKNKKLLNKIHYKIEDDKGNNLTGKD